jgi:WD40 repeat protein
MGLSRTVALKMISAGASGPHALARFRTEVKAVARLRHPHIVQVYDAGEADGQPYLALEFIEGGSLKDHLNGTPMPARAAAGLVETLALAVEHAHRAGILHRDLKPANVLLQATLRSETTLTKAGGDTAGRPPAVSSADTVFLPALDVAPKITDFGLALFLDAEGEMRTRTGEILGTPSYMAPEQAAGQRREAGPAIDVYALGAILYELLTGRPPFAGETPLATLLQVRYEEPVSVTRLRPGTSRDLATITMKCLEKEPRRRYPSAASLADDLARFREGRPVLARRVSWAGRVWRWSRRNPMVAGLLLALAFVVVTGFGAVLWEMEQARANAAAERKAHQEAEKQTLLAQEQRRRAERGEALSLLDQGVTRCRQGDLAVGLLLLADSLHKADRAEADDLLHAIRCNLAAWSRHLVPVTTGPAQGSSLVAVAWTPDGRVAATGPVGNAWGQAGPAEVRLWDPTTWQPVGKPLPHPLPVWGLAFSPNGRTLLAGCASSNRADAKAPGEAWLWDMASGTASGKSLPHPAGVQAVAFSRDGKMFATGCRDGAVRLWDASTGRSVGKPMRPEEGGRQQPVLSVAFSGDGHTLFAAAGRSVCSWDVGSAATGATFLHTASVTAVAVSPEGRHLLTGSADHTAQLWEVATGRRLGPPLVCNAPVWSVAFHPTKSLLITGSGARSARRDGDGAVRFWDAASLKPVGPTLLEGSFVHGVAVSPDGRHVLAAMEDGRPRHADVSRMSPLVDLTIRHSGHVRWVRYSPDGRSLMTVAVSDQQGSAEGELGLWDAVTGRSIAQRMPARTEGAQGRGFRIYFSPDGKAILNHLGHESCLVRDAATGALLGPASTEKEARGHLIEFRPDGKQFSVLHGGAALLWDVASNRQVGAALTHKGGVTAAAFNPEGTALLTAGGDGTTRLWDLVTRLPIGEPLRHASAIRTLAFAPDGRTFITTDQEDRMCRWDTASGQQVASVMHDADTKPRAGFRKLSFTPAGDYIAEDSWEALRLWEADTGRFVVALPNLGFASSSDSKWLALIPGNRYENPPWGPVNLWDMVQRRRRGLPETSTNAYCLDFHSEGRILAAGREQAAGLWDVATGKPIGPPLDHPGSLFALHFSPDGRRLATCCDDDTARLWEVPRPVEGKPEHVRLWIEVLTGHELDDSGDARLLSISERDNRRERLAALGGSPLP